MSHPKPALPLPSFTRRTLLQAALATAGTVGLSACGGGGTGGSAPTSKTLTMGAYQGDEVPRNAFKAMVEGYQGTAEPKINFVDHETFKNNINNYLQGSPDDAFGWFAGYRARFFASKNLVGDLTDVYKATPGIPEGLKKACSTEDGSKQIIMPATYYPWAVLYRKSVWQQNGFAVPKTLDELKSLGDKMKAKGIVPLAFADKDGWEAMGTFDILNLRINGYDYHISLMSGKEDWSGDKVVKVFDTWKGLLPYLQADSLGRSWQEAAQALQTKKAGMYLLGLFVTQQMTANLDDVDFFTFPEVDSTIGADAIDAPIDGFMMAKKPKNEAGAKALLGYLATGPAEDIYLKSDSSVVGVSSAADTTGYTGLQKKSAEVVQNAKSIAQFLDRDTNADLANTVITASLQEFIKNPSDIDAITASIQQQATSILG